MEKKNAHTIKKTLEKKNLLITMELNFSLQTNSKAI